jgi:DNA-nicking Smr family endonuclease
MKRKAPELADSALWDEVAKSVTPLRETKSPRKTAAPAKKTGQPVVTTATRPVLQEPRLPAAQRSAGPPPLSAFDRRTSQKMLRGQAEIDARIDLHGLGVEMARFHLLEFIAGRRQRGSRTILVITGKGASPFSGHLLHGQAPVDSPEREGKLRRALPRWLEDAAFRTHVVGYQPAHPRHGGGGAFYVRLRKWQG